MKVKLELILIWILVLLALSSFKPKRSFEGVIEYQIQAFDNDSNLIAASAGNKSIAYLKKGNYRQDYPNSKELKNIIYIQSENKYYTTFKNSEKVHVQDYSIMEDTLIEIIRSSRLTPIMGIMCKSLTLKFKLKKVTFYYDEHQYVNPKFFKDHKHFSYDIYVKEAKAVYLKIVIAREGSAFVMTATSLKKMKLNSDLFKVAKNGV